VTLNTTNTTSNSDVTWTVRQVLDWTVEHLKDHGSETPRLDTEILLAYARSCQRVDLYTHFDDVLSNNERATMRELVKRRAKAEPVAYLVEFREFFSLDFRVSPDVMIPRPETETLVMESLELARSLSAPRILDLGTGSGCIAIAIVVNLSHAALTATDISEPALALARQNAKDHSVGDLIEFLHGDLFDPLGAGTQFEVIASNPPYVARSELETLPDDVRRHEPRLALDGGPDGLAFFKRIISRAAEHLVDSGHLLLEIDPPQAQAISEFLVLNGSYTEIKLLKDLAGKVRVVHAQRAA